MRCLRRLCSGVLCVYLLGIVLLLFAFAQPNETANSLRDPLSEYELPFEALTEEEQARTWEELKFRAVLEQEYSSPLYSFDVAPDGSLALVTRNNQLILICHTGEEETRCCFSFDQDGILGVTWHNDQICLYLLKSQLLVEITQEGQLLGISKLKYEDYDVQKQLERVFFQTSAEDSLGNVYSLIEGKRIFPESKSYASLEQTGADGTVTEIYNVEKAVMKSQAVKLLLVFLWAALLVFLFFRSRRRKTTDE